MLSWHKACNACKYEKTSLVPAINAQTSHELIDEVSRETSLKDLRISNFRVILEKVITLKPPGNRLLDVGCAHGWFLEEAKGSFIAEGIEPDTHVQKKTLVKGLSVKQGFFPEVLKSDEKYDVISFNDVFEHIPDVTTILNACQSHLNPDGLLVINLPSSSGFFYRLSKMFFKLGKPGFFERLWQKDLPSPHLHYFNSDNLSRLVQSNGFSVEHTGNLSTLSMNGLFTRLSYTGNSSLLKNMIMYVLITLSLPFLSLLPSDIIYLIAKKKSV